MHLRLSNLVTKTVFSGTLLIFAIARSLLAAETITQEELVRRTQQLFDAVIPGDQAPWKQYFADDCIFADEKGRIMDKQSLIADIAPLPNGYAGSIKIVRPQSRIIGDNAILSYDLDETESIYGQNLNARYHEIDTWIRRNGNWQIVASQAMRYYADPAVGKTDRARFKDLVGTYELAPGQTRTLTTEWESFSRAKGKA